MGSLFSFRSNHLKSPLLGHIHVPKTAGSSFRSILDSHFGESHLHLYGNNGTTFTYENESLAQLLSPPKIAAFSSHFVRRFPAKLGGREVRYVTFMRNPIEQFVSYITYTRKHFAGIQDPVLLTHLPPKMPDLTIRECAKWILNAPTHHFRNFQENYNTNFFARYPLLDSNGFLYGSSAYKTRRLNAAKQTLRGFLMVGISERMDESWTLLRKLSSKVAIHLPDVKVPVVNVTSGERESLDWIHPDDEVGGMLLTSCTEDNKLYRWSVDRFQLKLAGAGLHLKSTSAPVGGLIPARYQGSLT